MTILGVNNFSGFPKGHPIAAGEILGPRELGCGVLLLRKICIWTVATKGSPSGALVGVLYMLFPGCKQLEDGIFIPQLYLCMTLKMSQSLWESQQQE